MPDLFEKDRELIFFPEVQEMVHHQSDIPEQAVTIQKRKLKRAKNIHYEPTELDAQILTYVKEYHLLTAWQLVNLHYAKGSKIRANTKLQILCGKSSAIPCKAYLYRDTLDKKTAGNPTFVYCLATDGLNYLRKNGFPKLARRFRPCEADGISYLHKLHCLNVNDILIAARNVPKALPDITLALWLHDFDLQKTPAVVSFDRQRDNAFGDGIVQEKVRIVPDGMLDFRLKLYNTEQKERRRVLLLEVDRGTETSSEEFKKRVLGYVHFCLPEGGFEQRFGKANKRVAYLITRGGQQRLNTLLSWCEEVLTEQNLTQEQNLFRFTRVEQLRDQKTGRIREELAISPLVFVSSVWYQPFATAPDTLLWKP